LPSLKLIVGVKFKQADVTAMSANVCNTSVGGRGRVTWPIKTTEKYTAYQNEIVYSQALYNFILMLSVKH